MQSGSRPCRGPQREWSRQRIPGFLMANWCLVVHAGTAPDGFGGVGDCDKAPETKQRKGHLFSSAHLWTTSPEPTPTVSSKLLGGDTPCARKRGDRSPGGAKRYRWLLATATATYKTALEVPLLQSSVLLPFLLYPPSRVHTAWASFPFCKVVSFPASFGFPQHSPSCSTSVSQLAFWQLSPPSPQLRASPTSPS